MKDAKSNQPPEVKATTDGFVNWYEFVEWACRNQPLWNSAMNYCAVAGLGQDAYLKIIAYHLTVENREMKAKLVKAAEECGKPFYP